MFKYDNFDYERYAMIVNSCELRAKQEVDNTVEGGEVSLDYVALTFLKGVDINKLCSFGLLLQPISDTESELIAQVGFGNKHKRFCQVMTEFLRQAGIMSVIKTRT
ncbi:MAG: hypothetical protein [Caudoviricetes sp.]|nr:MAG: hypothetical protein [Caudoviricetes sp.]